MSNDPLKKISARSYDVMVIGTGMGGAVTGYACARAGLRVLFLEKGRAQTPQAFHGSYPESGFPGGAAPAERHRLLLEAAGRCSDSVEDQSGKRTDTFVPFIGSGAGGSTAIYGAVLERFHARDFTPRSNFSQPGASTVPEAWPIRYEQMLPYYKAAEKLFGVRGGADGQATTTPPSSNESREAEACQHPDNQALWKYLKSQGLNPYGLPIGQNKQGKEEAAGQGILDHKSSRSNAWQDCIKPAVEKYGAQLLDQCRVGRMDTVSTSGRSVSSIGTVTEVHCVHRGRKVTLRAKMVVLAAGAMATPSILLRSRSALHPNGLANGSGQVGRNLMRHFVDLYALRTPGGRVEAGETKELGFNDWYFGVGAGNNEKYGVVQSFGALPPAEIMVAELEDEVRMRHPWLAPGVALAKPLLRYIIRSQVGPKLIMASVLEDLPYYENRVEPGRSAGTPWRINYQLHPYEQQRVAQFRTHLKKLFRPWRGELIKQAENNRRLAHVCGTCRFGEDPRNSVLDQNNRAHELENLYVVDASFFPSSAGTNPGLTIAANALRVAEHLADRLNAQQTKSADSNVSRTNKELVLAR